MVNHATPMRVLSALIQSGASHKNSSVRAIAAGCIKDGVEKITVQKCLASKDMSSRLISTVEKFCTDGNPDTRYYGKLILYWCMDVPNFENLCQRYLSASAARNIKDMCDKLAAKGVGPVPTSSDRTSGRYRSQAVSRAQTNLSATYPSNSRDSRLSQDSMNATLPVDSTNSSVNPSPRVPRRGGPRRDVRESSAPLVDRIPPSLYSNLSSSNWNDRYNGIAELLELSVKQSNDVKRSIVKICDAFAPRLKDNNSKVNLYALQCLLRMVPHIGSALDSVLTPLTEYLIPNLASQRANIVTLTNKILDGIHHHIDNSLILIEYCRIARSQSNPRIKPIILDKLCDIIPTVYEQKHRLAEQATIPLLVEHHEYLGVAQSGGPHNLGAYVGRLTSLLHEAMGSRLLAEVNKAKPAAAATIREYLMSGT